MILTIDFETEAIDGNPVFSPPKPVGVALKFDDQPSEYLAWGHPTGNNVTWEAARAYVLTRLHTAEKGDGWIAHNAAFESAILRKYFDYTAKDPLKVHDTMFLLFLTNPYAPTFALKPSAERELGLPPEEQDALRDWILRNVPGSKMSDFGAYISKTPVELCAPYAKGDTDRTYALYQKLHPRMMAMGMLSKPKRKRLLITWRVYSCAMMRQNLFMAALLRPGQRE